MTDATALLDQPPLSPAELGDAEAVTRELLGTTGDIVLMQGEAILSLEAVARGIAAPGRTALNIVTGPYGLVFGGWMREQGAAVVDLASEFDAVIAVDAVVAALDQVRPEVLAIVHAEAATGGTNPLPAILAEARRRGVLTIVDAVASVGAEPLAVDNWGIDVTVIGAQKALAGPAGVSAVALSGRAWDLLDANDRAPRGSSLSLLDWRDGWLRTDRRAIPGLPAWLESRAYVAALERVLREGIGSVQHRHARAAAATIAGAAELGLKRWQRGLPATFAPIVTTLRIPAGAGFDGGELGGILSAGNGPLRGSLLRVNHTGRSAGADPVVDALGRLGDALGIDATAAQRTAIAVFAGA